MTNSLVHRLLFPFCIWVGEKVLYIVAGIVVVACTSNVVMIKDLRHGLIYTMWEIV